MCLLCFKICSNWLKQKHGRTSCSSSMHCVLSICRAYSSCTSSLVHCNGPAFKFKISHREFDSWIERSSCSRWAHIEHKLFCTVLLYNNCLVTMISIKNGLFQLCTASHTLLMMTAESMLSKRPVLRFSMVLLFLLSYFRPIFSVF